MITVLALAFTLWSASRYEEDDPIILMVGLSCGLSLVLTLSADAWILITLRDYFGGA